MTLKIRFKLYDWILLFKSLFSSLKVGSRATPQMSSHPVNDKPVASLEEKNSKKIPKKQQYNKYPMKLNFLISLTFESVIWNNFLTILWKVFHDFFSAKNVWKYSNPVWEYEVGKVISTIMSTKCKRWFMDVAFKFMSSMFVQKNTTDFIHSANYF